MRAFWSFTTRTPAGFIFASAIVWWLMQLVARPGLDSYGDMAEVYGWSQHWLMGSDKHPQFLPWVTKIWFSVIPHSVGSFYLLAAINLGVGLAGIAALGRATGMNRDEVLTALALQVLAFPYLTLSAKLNMNSVLLAVWPWAAYAFLRVTQTADKQQKLWAAGLGVIAAAAVLAKYYSFVLLVGLLAASLMPRLRGLWKGSAPYIFSAVFLIALSPHILWLTQHAESLTYASSQGGGGISPKYLLKFLLSPLLYWPIPLIIALGWLYRGNVLLRVSSLLRLQTGDEVLWFCAVGPLIVTLLFGLTGKAELSMPWAIPIGFAFTLLMLRNRTRRESGVLRLPTVFPYIWAGFIVLGIIYTMVNGAREKTWHYMPEAESTETVLEGWRQLHPDKKLKLSWAATGNAAARLAFFAPGENRPEALPALPDDLPDYYPPRSGWASEAGVVICAVRKGPPLDADKNCQKKTIEWAEHHGLRAKAFSDQVHRSGWRFPETVPFSISAVYVWP